MKLLIIGDVHNKIGYAERICEQFPDHKKIFVGDYFDDFGDTPWSAQRTAEWLKESLTKPDRVHLFGNHDYPYYINGLNRPLKLVCSGFSLAKLQEIQKILTLEDWKLLKYYHYENGWYFSHAGFTQQWWGHPMTGDLSVSRIESVLEECELLIDSNREPDPLWAADFFRGGRNHKGGLLWNDWRNLDYIPNVWQVVGHTPNNHISVREDPVINAKKILVDCGLDEVLEIKENGEFTKILDPNRG